MCGIAGFISLQGEPLEAVFLKNMMGPLARRGPDGAGWVLGDFRTGHETGEEKGTIGFAHTRLAIIDLSDAAAQPMEDRGHLCRVVFNGEIYNYQSLRQELKEAGHTFFSESDTEVLLAGYLKFGMDFLSRLQGMYAFALWDKRKGQVYLCRDSIGIKPLFYFQDERHVAFASNVRSLLALPWISRNINPLALQNFVTTGYLPGKTSIFEKLSKVLPGTFLKISAAGIETFRHEDLTKTELDYFDGEAEAIGALEQALRESVKQHLLSDVPVGAFLSGGIDSTLITAIAQQVSSKPIFTLTIGFDEPAYDETPFAEHVARHLGTRHQTHRISGRDLLPLVSNLYEAFDEPMADATVLPTLLFSSIARQHFKVCLSGEGGDELFHGYLWYDQILRSRRWFQLPRWLRRGVLAPWRLEGRFRGLTGLKEKTFGENLTEKLAIFTTEERILLLGDAITSVRAELKEIFDRIAVSPEALSQGLLRMALKTWLPEDFLLKVDRASMYSGLEVRVPFLTREMVRLAQRVPLTLKKREGKNKYILRKILSTYVPESLVNRPKKGFSVPLDRWLQNELQPLAGDLLEMGRIKRQGLFNADYISSLKEAFRRHPAVNARRLWLLLSFQLWYEKNMVRHDVGVYA